MSSPALLDGVRVLDLSRVLAGPWCGQLLADYGADVIKVERPGAGDDTRGWGPPWWGEGERRTAAYYLSANRGKRSVAIDLASAEGAAMVRQLAAEADVLLENYKVGQLAKYGLDHASLSALNPRLIYCSITGYGQDGPYAQAAGYDFAIQATGGLMSITGERDGTPGTQPQKVGVAVADLFTGACAATAVLAALHRRDATGLGCHIDAALLDTQVAMLANQASNWLVGGLRPKRMGNAHPNIVPYQVFATRDGHIVLAVGNDGQFARFCELAGHPEVARDARYATNEARNAHRAALVVQITGWMLERDTAGWMALLEPHAVPCAPILEVPEVFTHPQVLHRGMQVAVDGVPMVGTPMRIDGERPTAPLPPPALDEHGDAVRAALAAGRGWPGRDGRG
ncbi:CaiB/BaiF CoA transferase family protein [Azohydromonas australica]|uniref:CaiB/BaiF CoA transferase family protein n=1 Tax=Azohydromonas australica TaxID=364039 RepID=UPI0003FA882A|nr:CaiB/BaiF CoA-transferase family protein [Azohydromonas australica]